MLNFMKTLLKQSKRVFDFKLPNKKHIEITFYNDFLEVGVLHKSRAQITRSFVVDSEQKNVI